MQQNEEIICNVCYDSASSTNDEFIYFKKNENICHRICQSCIENYFNNLTHNQIDNQLQICCMFCNTEDDKGKRNVAELLFTLSDNAKKQRYMRQYTHAVKAKQDIAQNVQSSSNSTQNNTSSDDYNNVKRSFEKCILETCPSCNISVLPVETVDACSAITCENCNTIFCKACHYYVDKLRATEFYVQQQQTYSHEKHERLIHRHIKRKHYDQDVYIPTPILMCHRSQQIQFNLTHLVLTLNQTPEMKTRLLQDPDLNTYLQNLQERYGTYDNKLVQNIRNILNDNDIKLQNQTAQTTQPTGAQNRNEGNNYCSLSNVPHDPMNEYILVILLSFGFTFFNAFMGFTYLIDPSTYATDVGVRSFVKFWRGIGRGIKYAATKAWAGIKYAGTCVAKCGSFTLHHILPVIGKGLLLFCKWVVGPALYTVILPVGIMCLMMKAMECMISD